MALSVPSRGQAGAQHRLHAAPGSRHSRCAGVLSEGARLASGSSSAQGHTRWPCTEPPGVATLSTRVDHESHRFVLPPLRFVGIRHRAATRPAGGRGGILFGYDFDRESAEYAIDVSLLNIRRAPMARVAVHAGSRRITPPIVR